MGIQRQYKELVFTNHALDRLKQRRVEPSEAWAAWRRPDKKYYAATKQAWVFQRSWGHRQIEVVAKEQEVRKGSSGSGWVVLSVWSNYVRFKPKRLWMNQLFRWIWRRINS